VGAADHEITNAAIVRFVADGADPCTPVGNQATKVGPPDPEVLGEVRTERVGLAPHSIRVAAGCPISIDPARLAA
jgi:hypothetical protein